MATLTLDGLELTDGDTYLFTRIDRTQPAARRVTIAPYAGRPGGAVVAEPPGPRLLRVEAVVFAPADGTGAGSGAAAWRTNRDALIAALARPGIRIRLDTEGGRLALRATARDLRVTRAGRGHYAVSAEFVCDDAYLGAEHPTADARALALTLAPGETALRRMRYDLTVTGTAPAPARVYLAHSAAAVVPSLWALANLSTGLDAERYPRSPRRLSVIPPAGLAQPAALVWDGDRDEARAVACGTKGITGWWPLCDPGPALYDLSGNDRDLAPYPYTLTLSGNEITDTVRAAGAQGDGRSADSSMGIWPASTNLAYKNYAADPVASGSFGDTGGAGATRTSLGSGRYRLTGGSGGSRLRMLAPLADLGDGASYAVSLFYANRSGTVTIDWCDLGYVALGTAGYDLDLGGGVHRAYTSGARAYDATYRFFDVELAAGAQVDVWWAQIEAGYMPTPYIASASARAKAHVTMPVALLNETQGWIALRLRPGWGSTTEFYGGAGFPVWFGWGTPGGDYISLHYREPTGQVWFDRLAGGGGGTAAVAHAPTIGTPVTIVCAWTATAVKLSIGGVAFTSAAATAIPSLSAISPVIGGWPAHEARYAGDILWAATGTGTLTDADAAALAALGSTDPTTATFGSAAAVTGVFGCATAYGAGAAVTYQRDCLHPTLAGVALDGVRGALESTSSALQFAGSFSWGCWVTFDTLSTAGIAGKAETNKGYYLGATGGYAVIAAGTGAATVSGAGSLALSAGRRHFVCGVFDATAQTLTLYLDAACEAVVATGGAISHTSVNPFRVGAAHHPATGTAAFVDGVVSEPFAIAAALTAAQVRDMAADGVAALGDFVAWRGAPVTVNPRATAAGTNTIELRADHATTAPAGRAIVAYRPRYE